jgi:hypothetical protein
VISWLESLPTLVTGILVVGGFVALTLVLGYLVGTFTSLEIRTAHNDRAGFILAVIGVIYAVLLAFVAISVWERFQQAESRAYNAAGTLATIYRDSGSFPRGGQVRAMLRAYVRSVIDDEWPRIQRGERPALSNAFLDAADRYILGLPVTSPRLQNIHADMLAAIDSVLMDRQNRLTIDLVGINGVMWLVLIAGALITVGFTYLFGFDHPVMQLLMIGGLSLLIGLVLFLIVALDYPFRGSIAVGPDAYRALLESFSATHP